MKKGTRNYARELFERCNDAYRYAMYQNELEGRTVMDEDREVLNAIVHYYSVDKVSDCDFDKIADWFHVSNSLLKF